MAVQQSGSEVNVAAAAMVMGLESESGLEGAAVGWDQVAYTPPCPLGPLSLPHAPRGHPKDP